MNNSQIWKERMLALANRDNEKKQISQAKPQAKPDETPAKNDAGARFNVIQTTAAERQVKLAALRKQLLKG